MSGEAPTPLNLEFTTQAQRVCRLVRWACPRSSFQASTPLIEQFKLLVAGCDCSVKDLPCAAGIGLGVEVCQEALGNAVSSVWLKPA